MITILLRFRCNQFIPSPSRSHIDSFRFLSFPTQRKTANSVRFDDRGICRSFNMRVRAWRLGEQIVRDCRRGGYYGPRDVSVFNELQNARQMGSMGKSREF